MIKGLWNKVEVVCGCHEKKGVTPEMTLKAGHKSMFYTCPKYYPDARDKDEIACINHVTTDDFQKILEKVSAEAEEQMVFGQSISLKGLKFKIKMIEVEVLDYTSEKIVIKVKNKKALQG